MVVLTELRCTACGASLPAPRVATVQCEYCQATFAVSRAAGNAGSKLASKDAPGYSVVALNRSLMELHHWLIDQAGAATGVDPDFVAKLASEKLTTRRISVWLFTVQMKGGFTAMVGVDEKRTVVVKAGKDIETRRVTETRWTPFSSQLRLNRCIYGSTGGTRSQELAATLSALDNPKAIIENAASMEAGQLPGVSAEDSWQNDASKAAKRARDREAERLMQGDAYKDLKHNVEVTWQPSVVDVEVASCRAGSGYDLVSLANEIVPFGHALAFPTRDHSERDALVDRSHREHRRFAKMKMTLVAAGALATAIGLLGGFAADSKELSWSMGIALVIVLMFGGRIISASPLAAKAKLARRGMKQAVEAIDEDEAKERARAVKQAHEHVDELYAAGTY